MTESKLPESIIADWQNTLTLLGECAAVDAVYICQLRAQPEFIVADEGCSGDERRELLLSACATHLQPGADIQALEQLSIGDVTLGIYPIYWPSQVLFGGLLIVSKEALPDEGQLPLLRGAVHSKIQYDLEQLYRTKLQKPTKAPDPYQDKLPSLQAFIDSFTDHVWLKDLEGTYICANRSVVEAWGRSPIGDSDSNMFDAERGALFATADRQAIEAGEQIVTEECSDALDPERKNWLETVKAPVISEDGTLIGTVGMTRNVTKRKLVEEQLSLAATVFANSLEGVLITDINGTIIEINNSFSDITGYSRQEVLGHNPRLLKSGRHGDAFYEDMWAALLNEGRWQGELWNRRKDGSIYPQFTTVSSVYDDNGSIRYYVSVFSDISQQKKDEAKLAHMAFHDPLTDLPNRIQLKSQLEQELYHAQRLGSGLAVVFLDVDHFKHINDSAGHLIGDEVLCEISTRLSTRLRVEDMVARIGGDEFVVILNDVVDIDAATTIVNKLMEIFAEPLTVSTGDQLRLTGSIGIALYPDDGEDSDTLLRNADAAMYRAKRGGRNNYAFYTEALTKQSVDHLRLQGVLHKALDEEQFFLTYQPQIEIATGSLVGFEALVRWQHPTRGLVSPGEFIPVADRIGLLADIGLLVLREACTQGKRWLQSGYQFGRIAVNVAGCQLQREGFVESVRKVLAETGFPASALELEVTEGFVMQNPEQAIETLLQLRALGIELAIDDFGTGYSSLSYLKRLPLNKLKIDRSFVRDIPDDNDNKAIAEAIIAMGKALSLRVIAEGVETSEQARFLESAGCEFAQGYLFSRPEPAANIETFLN